MKRRLFNILSAVSLVASVAVSALWVHSLFVGYYLFIPHGTGGRGSSLSISPAGISLNFGCASDTPWRFGWSSCSVANGWSELQYWRIPQYHPSYNGLDLSFGFLELSCLALPAFWCWKQWKRRRGYREGHCLKCGYDLRASKERCPECGTPIPAGASPVSEDKTGSTARNT
jgi:hypothetical protein